MKKYFTLLIVIICFHNANAGGNIVINNGCGIRVPIGSQICADTIAVSDSAFYITDVPEGTCPEAFVTGNGNIVLPVELSSFTAEVDNDYVILRWKTETENDNYGFEIERRSETNEWKKIGFAEGHGNSNSLKLYEYKDLILSGYTKFFYRLKQIDFSGDYAFSDIIEVLIMPLNFWLNQNYPNPFNPATVIQFSIPLLEQEKIHTSLKVYDILGNLVSTLVDEVLSAGRYEIIFNASGLSSGVYLYRFISGNFEQTNKMILLR